MPLDGHAHLVSQGWAGTGSALRHGSISRPVVIAQKKTLSGVGKDRDDAFPFWDHVFSAAASNIKIKVYDSDSEDTDPSEPAVNFQRTKTGIISNRRPIHGTPASGTATPGDPSSSSGTSTPRLSVMAAAKQEAARRALYSSFFRGPIIGLDVLEDMSKVQNEEGPKLSRNIDASALRDAVVHKTSDVVSMREKGAVENPQRNHKAAKSRKSKEVADPEDEPGTDDERAPGSMLKRKSRELEKAPRKPAAQGRAGSKDKTGERLDAEKLERAEKKRLRAEKRARKEEKRRRKEERRAAKTPDAIPAPQSGGSVAGPGVVESGSQPEEAAKKKRKKGEGGTESKKRRKVADDS